jgi:hypothetical protein
MTARETMTAEQYEQHVETLAAQAPPLTPTQIAQLSGLFDYETPQPDSSARQTGNRRAA